MLFNKSCQNALLFSFKTYFNSTNSVSKFSSFKIPPRAKKIYLPSSILLASAALGVSVYVAFKRGILCETMNINDNDNIPLNSSLHLYDDAICKSRDLLRRIKDEIGIPGIVVGVSINGETVWTEGLGYADVENRVLCSADTVMRIASIGKSITMAAVAKLWEQGKLDIDKPVQDYVPYFPVKTFDGKPVTITCRQLVSHLGGIRHYSKTVNSSGSKKNEKDTQEEENEFEQKEYVIKEHYKDVKSAIDIFKDDPLIANPGSKFYYTTHGWTLVSAIVEAAAKESFSIHITKLFKTLGMSNSYLDLNDVLIYHRSRNYVKGKKGELMNAPYIDNSYKWAGGGLLSTVGDLLQFGNAMLYSLQFTPNIQSKNERDICDNEKNITDEKMLNSITADNSYSNKQTLPGYLKAKTVESMWSPVTGGNKQGIKYGMGWSVIPESNECMFCKSTKYCVYHTGGAIGASSILLIVPRMKKDKINDLSEIHAPKGIIVTILTNLHAVNNLSRIASNIAQFFDNS